ncbi:MAG TPA: group 1 truncated hemoglobin [Pyrinomonadaceae bacterium]|nr:group 1 truncated hemoglobin [Pyrinomonadaceae bacterium]
MLKVRPIIVALCLCLTLVGTAAAQDKSLYERLGGSDALKAVVDDFVGRAAGDDRINKKFGKTDIHRLKFYLVEQLCAATGGPCKYTGRDMKTTHKNMKVTEGEFNALVEDLVASLDHFNVPEKEKNELLGILGPLKDQIVEVKGNATGTALPANYKNAPPLKMEEKKM